MANWVADQWEMFFEIPHKYNADDCNDALHGSRVPEILDEPSQRLCTIRGIRHHYKFAQELRGVAPEFTRALNARDMMTGIIPTISQPKETLYSPVQQYPDMLYHAARACAVARYSDLYQELDPLPEVHVAEEAGYASAQRSNNGSQQIYQHILSQPVKFAIMNDYTRTVDVAGRRVASLNGDTAVYSSLTARSKHLNPNEYSHPRKPWTMFGNKLYYSNITDDWGIDDHDCEAPETPDDYLPLVYNPLPAELPLINKDKPIHVAAYKGEIDRYARLRRPKMLEDEWAMVWASQIPKHPDDHTQLRIRGAINARRIMSDDLTWLAADTPEEVLPTLIWYPEVASGVTW
ncbi:hypothetical protein N7490_007249 [Penicillium lividum]|nr:hypothetical protein N7490_007249 [Penicillium lividum]